MKSLLLLSVPFFVLTAGAVDWTALNAASREQAKSVLRPGEPGKAPFWNAKARAFIHPPAFDFKTVPGASAYRFTVTEKANGKAHIFTAAVPWAPLAPVWDELPPGYVTIKTEGLDADGAVCGVAGVRDCYRAAVFKGPYPTAANDDYAGAARRCYAAVAHLPHVRQWLTATEPPKRYDLYCYPSKILSSMIRAILRYAATAPAAEKAECHQICRNMADWLISVSQPADAALPHLPPTYWGDRRSTAVQYRGQNMLIYPFEVATAYFQLADATGDAKYRDEGLAICRTLLKMQNAEGTWWLKVYEKDGRPVRPNLIVPQGRIVDCFRTAACLTGDAAFAKGAERAREYELKGPFATWNWDGQFEDVDPLPPYSNLEKSRPADFAGWMFEKGRTADGRLLVDWCEDQFVVWSDPIHHMDWRHWKMPTALEQYEYYTPIDASMGNLISAFAKAWTATGDELYREKAKALADCVLRHQRPNGTIPTYFDTRSDNDWVNCMVYTSECLEELAAALAR